MSKPISQQEQSLHVQISQANEKIVALESKLRALDDELASHLSQRPQYQLLEEICASLDKLSMMGAADLFHGATGSDPEKQLQQLSGVVAGYQPKISSIEQSRAVLQADIENERTSAQLLDKHLAELQAASERDDNELVVERRARERPYHAVALPWSRHGADERFYHKLLFTILFLTVVFGVLVPILKPPVETSAGIVVPQRIAQLIKKKEEAKRVEQKLPEKTAEKKEEKVEDKIADKPKPTDADTLKARKSAETKGVLALKNSFADLMKESAPLKLGADARISNKSAQTASGPAQRSIIVSQATSGSGGINTSALSRQSEGTGGQRIAGISFERIESAAGAAAGGGEIQPGKKGQPSRTDEEIQIVFDRYKSALYRIYNRELRSNPTLRGKMVLRIVIEPDGRVSACSVKSTDLDSPALSSEIVDRVLKFNFGTKEGVTAITILYPIDFLPAS